MAVRGWAPVVEEPGGQAKDRDEDTGGVVVLRTKQAMSIAVQGRASR